MRTKEEIKNMFNKLRKKIIEESKYCYNEEVDRLLGCQMALRWMIGCNKTDIVNNIDIEKRDKSND